MLYDSSDGYCAGLVPERCMAARAFRLTDARSADVARSSEKSWKVARQRTCRATSSRTLQMAGVNNRCKRGLTRDLRLPWISTSPRNTRLLGMVAYRMTAITEAALLYHVGREPSHHHRIDHVPSDRTSVDSIDDDLVDPAVRLPAHRSVSAASPSSVSKHSTHLCHLLRPLSR